jgi:hypothetical protein
MSKKNNPADKVEQWPIEKLVPYAKNSRTHSEDQIAQLAASIKEWGFTSAILVDEDGGIIAGHGRVLAARKLGLPEVPCIRLGHLTDAQKRAYVIADNRLQNENLCRPQRQEVLRERSHTPFRLDESSESRNARNVEQKERQKVLTLITRAHLMCDGYAGHAMFDGI